MITIDLSKQQALDADPNAIQQINFTGNLERDDDAIMFCIIEKAKETILDFSQRTVNVLWMSWYASATTCSTILFCYNVILI